MGWAAAPAGQGLANPNFSSLLLISVRMRVYAVQTPTVWTKSEFLAALVMDVSVQVSRGLLFGEKHESLQSCRV